MNRRNIVVVVGLFVAALVVLRRRRRRGRVRIEIDEPHAADRPVAASVEFEEVELESLDGIGPAYAERLRNAGVADLDDLVGVDADDLARESGIEPGRIRNWVERARGRVDG